MPFRSKEIAQARGILYDLTEADNGLVSIIMGLETGKLASQEDIANALKARLPVLARYNQFMEETK